MTGFILRSVAIAAGFLIGEHALGLDLWPMFYGSLVAAVVFGAAEGWRHD